jgi:hypothetical protein
MELFHTEEEATLPTLVGENCHIVAESDGGPRANPTMSIPDRNSYQNLILLCRNHHKVIDDLPNGPRSFPVLTLQSMKVAHESWVKDQLGYDQSRQFQDEQFAEILDAWERLAHVDDWLAWSSHMLGPQPRMRMEVSDDFGKLSRYILTRVWPDRYLKLADAFKCFWRILEDLRGTFHKHAEPWNENILLTRKFYKIDRWDEDLYSKLARQFEWHVDLCGDLVLELTRSANMICDLIRTSYDPRYRLGEGKLMVQRGPNYPDGSFYEFVPEYTSEERAKTCPYAGFETFLVERSSRKNSLGNGNEPS